jgi:hypothetical protein
MPEVMPAIRYICFGARMFPCPLLRSNDRGQLDCIKVMILPVHLDQHRDGGESVVLDLVNPLVELEEPPLVLEQQTLDRRSRA